MTTGLPPFVRNGPIGVLPPGRWPASWDEFVRVFAPSGSSRLRRAVMEDFDTFARLQREAGLVVSSYWVNGSFVTTKANPNDVDVVALVNGSSASRPANSAWELLNPGARWKREAHPDVGRILLVHAFAVVMPPLEAGSVAQAEFHGLLQDWDEWFRRFGDQPNRKGYVEVRL